MSKLDIVGICSGYFNPLHDGHLEYLHAALDYCYEQVKSNDEDVYLLVIINNDKQVRLKGSIPFLPDKIREQIISDLAIVDSTFISKDNDLSVAQTLQLLTKLFQVDQDNKFYFINAGDRSSSNFDQKEHAICKKYGIEEVWLDLPKINSSSEILNKVGREWFERRLKNEQN